MNSTATRGVLAIIRNPAGAVLMHLRDRRDDICWPNCWSVLGGGVEPGETFLDAAVREVREESGIQVTDMVEICEVVDVQGSGQRLRVFAGSYHGEASKLVLGEGQRLEFILPHVWPRIDIPPFVRALLERVAAV